MKIPVETDSPKDFQPRLRLSRVGFIVSLPLLALLTYGGWQALIDPSFWSGSESEALQELTLSPAQSLGEIKESLKQTGRTLGNPLILEKTSLLVYPVFNGKKHLEEIRVYQPGGKKFRGKFHLVDAVGVSGLAKSIVEAPRQRYAATSNRRTIDPLLPFTELRLLGGEAPKQGIWFLAAGTSSTSKVGAHGLIFHVAVEPQPQLFALAEWTSPVGKFPLWQEMIALPPKPGLPDQPEIVVDQTVSPDPYFQIFRLVDTKDLKNPYQLRSIELGERAKIGKTYRNALALARAGLWSLALEIWQRADPKLSVLVQEQHAYIAYHAQLTAQQARQELTDPAERVKNLLVDGRFQEALRIATQSEDNAKRVLNILRKGSDPVWFRVQAALQVGILSGPAKIWGSIIVLSKDGLPAAEQWLADRGGVTQEARVALDAVDVAPLAIKPQQFLGTVTPLSEVPGDGWYLPVGTLAEGQSWYVIDLMLVRDGDIWKNAPIAEFGERSASTVWKALGMQRNNILNVVETDRESYTTFFSLAARSIQLGRDGSVKILASGSEYLSAGITPNRLPIIAVSGGGLSQAPTMPLQNMNPTIADRVTAAIYRELETLGQVSLDLVNFQQRLAAWNFYAMDINGDGGIEYVLQIQQDQIDLGNRYYPLVAVFDVQGNLIYNTIREASPRNWVAILPSGGGGQILTELDGRYEIWDF